MSHPRALLPGPVLLLAALLAACADSAHPELQAWMSQQKSQATAAALPSLVPSSLPPPMPAQAALLDPFSPERLGQASKAAPARSLRARVGLLPEPGRRKEPLEAWPLAVMALVGTVAEPGQALALVRVDKLLYQVRPGQYLGPDFGRVVRISESAVTLRELVQDGSGAWVERTAILHLQETAK